MCPVLFLADAHLRGPEDPNQPALIEFLDRRAAPGCGLVILGDLFEYLAGEVFRSLPQPKQDFLLNTSGNTHSHSGYINGRFIPGFPVNE